jgi:hypothetical protein
MMKIDEVDDPLLLQLLHLQKAWAERRETDYCPDDLESMRRWLYMYWDSYERLPALLEVIYEIDSTMWIRLLGEIWDDCDNIGEHKDLLLKELNEWLDCPLGIIPELMDKDERRAFKALPDQFTIYRGCGPENRDGLSWSLSRDVAARFPFLNKYRTDRPLLLTATINKNRVAALKLGRNEQEVVVLDPSAIRWTEEPLSDPPAIEVKPLTRSEASNVPLSRCEVLVPDRRTS